MAVNSFNAQNPPVTTKGDVFTFSTIPTRLGVGANNTVLTADSTTATGLKWATPAASGANWTLLNAGGTALTGGATVTVSGISNADKIMVLVSAASSDTASSTISVRVNGQTGSIYYRYGQFIEAASAYSANNFDYMDGTTTSIQLARMSATATGGISGGVTLTGCNSSGVKQFSAVGGSTPASSNGQRLFSTQGYVDLSATITSVSVFSGTGNLDAGTVFVYTSA